MKTTKTIASLLGLGLLVVRADETKPLYGLQPIWTSQTTHCGGDGNARLLDVDQDGDLDLVTSAPNPRRWVIFENRNGKLAKTPNWNSIETSDCDHISVLDFNGDGRSDLAATHESHCTLYLNDQSRNPSPFASHPDWETGTYIDANQINFGDYDNDGDLDMLMAAGLPFLGLALFENRGITPERTVTQRIGIREYSEASIFSDFDADGDLDIVATFPKKGTVILYANTEGRFDDGTQLYHDPKVTHCQRVYSLDLDQDGKNELICAKGPWGPPGASVVLAQQTGTQQLKVTWRSAEDTGFHGFDFQDIDQDGDLDMAAADWSGKSVAVYLQQNGTFSAQPIWKVKVKAPAHEVALGDLDGDGDYDLAAGCLDQVYVFENLLR